MLEVMLQLMLIVESSVYARGCVTVNVNCSLLCMLEFVLQLMLFVEFSVYVRGYVTVNVNCKVFCVCQRLCYS